MIHVAIPSDTSIREKKQEKLEKYQGLSDGLERGENEGEGNSGLHPTLSPRAVTSKLTGSSR